jgi:hypothetical protein
MLFDQFLDQLADKGDRLAEIIAAEIKLCAA